MLEKYLDHLTSNVFELLNPVREGNDLSWADKGEVEGVEVDNNVLPSKVRKRHLQMNGVHINFIHPIAQVLTKL